MAKWSLVGKRPTSPTSARTRPATSGPTPIQVDQARLGGVDHGSDAGSGRLYPAVQRADISQVLKGQGFALPGDIVFGADQFQHRRSHGGAQLPARASGGELGQQTVQAADGLGARSTSSSRRSHHSRRLTMAPSGWTAWNTGGVEGSQADGDGVVPVGLTAMALGENPHPGGQFGRHVQDHLTPGHQALGQEPPGPVATLDGPTALPQRRAKRTISR